MWRADIEVPNHSVDMSSWDWSACYPRSTFYPLSDGPSIREPPDHYALVSYLIDLSVSQSSALIPLYSTHVYQSCWAHFGSLRYTFGGDHPSQTTTKQCPPHKGVRTQIIKGPYFKGDSTNTSVPASQSPAYPTHNYPNSVLSCSKGSRVFPSRCG